MARGRSDAADHPRIDFRRVPFAGGGHPPFDLGLQPGLIGAEVKRVEAVENTSHQVAHFVIVDVLDLGLRDAVAVGIHNGDVAPVAGPGDRYLAFVDAVEVGVSHA